MDSFDENLVSCAVCYEVYGPDELAPRSLLCGHSFCSRCLRQLQAVHLTFKCPTCMRVHDSQAEFAVNYPCLGIAEAYRNRNWRGAREPERPLGCSTCSAEIAAEELRVCMSCEDNPVICVPCRLSSHIDHDVATAAHYYKIADAKHLLTELEGTVAATKDMVERAVHRADAFLEEMFKKADTRREVAAALRRKKLAVNERIIAIVECAKLAIANLKPNAAGGDGPAEEEGDILDPAQAMRNAILLLAERLSSYSIPRHLVAKVDCAPDHVLKDVNRIRGEMQMMRMELEQRLQAFEQFVRDEIFSSPVRVRRATEEPLAAERVVRHVRHEQDRDSSVGFNNILSYFCLPLMFGLLCNAVDLHGVITNKQLVVLEPASFLSRLLPWSSTVMVNKDLGDILPTVLFIFALYLYFLRKHYRMTFSVFIVSLVAGVVLAESPTAIPLMQCGVLIGLMTFYSGWNSLLFIILSTVACGYTSAYRHKEALDIMCLVYAFATGTAAAVIARILTFSVRCLIRVLKAAFLG